MNSAAKVSVATALLTKLILRTFMKVKVNNILNVTISTTRSGPPQDCVRASFCTGFPVQGDISWLDICAWAVLGTGGIVCYQIVFFVSCDASNQ